MAISKPFARRYAHSEGATHIRYDSKRRLVTCGCDGDVRVFEGVEDDCFNIATGSETVTAIACYRKGDKDYAAIATGDFVVRTRCLDDPEDQLVMRFTASVNYLDASDDQGSLAAGASDFLIKVRHLVDEGDAGRTVSLTGHEAPVLCVKFDPVGKFLASSSCDGTARVWSLETSDCVKVLPILPKCSDVSLVKSLCYLAWHPKGGKVLAIPVGEHIKLYARDSWDCIGTLIDEHHKTAINVVSWSPSMESLASAGADGAVVLWNYVTRQPYMRCKNEDGMGITSLEWGQGMESDSGSVLVFGDKEGHIGTFKGVELQSEKGEESKHQRSLGEDSLLMEGIPADDIFGDHLDDDEPHSLFDREAAEVDGEEKRGGDDGEEEDDIGGPRRQRFGEAMMDDASDHGSLLGFDKPPAPNQPATSSKKPSAFSEKQLENFITSFQCSATPEDQEQRFMVYNLVGVVRSHVTDEASMIEVEFHNANTHHSFSVANGCGYTMAALSDQALALASRKTEDTHSQLYCTHFSSWDHSKDWTIPMPSKEGIVCIAIGLGWVAAATSKQMLRLFNHWLVVVYHSGPSTENVFTLHVWVLDVKRQKQVHPPHSLPLSHHAKLEWIGFSDRGLLISYDSKGMVRALSSKYALTWIPVFNAGKPLGNKADHYFLVGMTHDPDELRCILCKEHNYPPIHPKPVMSSLPLKIPLCESQLESTELEERYLRLEMLVTSGSSDTTKAAELMKGFALACKQNREYKGYELASLMPSEHSMKLALTYASRTSHVRLARYISELIQQRAMEEEEEERGREEGEEGSPDKMEDSRPALRRERSDSGAPGPESLLDSAMTGKTRLLNVKKAEHRSEEGGEWVGQPGRKGLGTLEKKDETKELFSDSECEEKPSSEGRTGEEETDKENAIAGEEDDQPESKATPHSPLYSTPGAKRPNPFKMTTPVSKRIEKERSSSFLDNIAARVDEEQKLNERKTKAKEKSDQSAKKTRKLTPKVVQNKSNQIQSSIKGGFFKQAKRPSEDMSSTEEVAKTTDAPPSPAASDSGGGVEPADQERASSKSKIASFAFESKQH
eukprot:Em0014g765a